MTRPAQTDRRDQDGAVLVIALVIITVFALLIGLILSEAQVAFKSTEVTGTIRNMTYASDGGVEYGIQQAESGYCSSPATNSTQVGSIDMTEPGVNPTATVSCQTASGNSLYNTFGGNPGSWPGTAPTPGYSVITNSSASGCVSLATDAIGTANQIKYNNHCATFGNATSPTLWSAASSSTTAQLNASSFLSPLPASPYSGPIGWAVGAPVGGGAANIQSYDGSDWTTVLCSSCASNLTLNSVYAIDSTDVWAVGSNGSILFNNDGGTGGTDNWQQLQNTSVPNGVTFQAVWAGDDNDVWAAGYNGGTPVVYYINQVSSGSFTVTPETLPSGGQPLYGLSGIGISTGGFDLWAVGKNGYLIDSQPTTVAGVTTSGATWASVSSGTTQPLQDITIAASAPVSGVSYPIGWAVGNQGVITSLSTAGTWSAQTSAATGTTQQLNGVSAFSTGTAGSYDIWAVGNQGVLDYSTGNGTWSVQAGPATNINVQGVGGVITTTASGSSATQSFDIQAVGQNGAIWSFNGFRNPTTGPVSNNGPPWTQQASGTNQQLNEVTGSVGEDLFAVGNNQGSTDTVLYSTDDSTWHAASVTANKGQQLYGVSALPGTNTAWAVGNGGQILATINGTTWSQETSNTNQQLNGVFALDSVDVWAVGNNQGNTETILFSGNAGRTWTAKGPTVSHGQPLEAVWAADASDVWAVGGQGQIYYSSNGGTNWTPQTSNTTQTLNGIYGVSASLIWAVGNKNGNALTIQSYSGANSWASVGPASSNAQNLNDVHAILNGSTPNVYAVGQGGLIYFYDGSSWAQQLGPKGGKAAKGPGVGNFFGTTAIGTGIGQAWAVGAQGQIWNYNPYSPTGMTIDSGGAIFNAGAPQLSSVLWASDSGYVQGNQGSCSPAPTVTNLYYTTDYSCNTPQPTVTENLPSSALPSGSCVPMTNHGYSGACQKNANPTIQKNVSGCANYVQFTPGIYAQAPKFSNGNFYFFPSGVYYFDNVGNIQLNGNGSTYLVGGTPAGPTAGESWTTGETPSILSAPSFLTSASNACWTYAQNQDKTAGTGNGVEFIFGGNTALQIQNGNIELFSRANGISSTEGAQGISIREACSGAGSGLGSPIPCSWSGTPQAGAGWDPSNLGGNGQILSFNNNAQSAVDIHGSIYAPDDNVELYSGTNPFRLPVAVGAVDCWSLETANQSYSSPAVEIQAAGPLDIRTVIITATAASGSGSVPVSEEVFVKLDSPGDDDVDAIYTWRYCSSAAVSTSGCQS